MNEIVRARIERFFANYPSRYADKDEVIIQNYSDPIGVIYLVAGRVKQYDIDGRGVEIIVNSFRPYDIFPMTAVFDQTKNSYFYESTTDIEYKIAPKSDVADFLNDNHDICYDLLGYLYSYVNDIQQRMACMMRGSARSRTIFEILAECRRFGKRQKNGSYFIGIREDQLASQTGLTRETVNREISGLKHLKIISINHRGLVVHDINMLRQELGVDK